MMSLALVLTTGAAISFYIALRKAQAERDDLAIQIRLIVYGLDVPLVQCGPEPISLRAQL